MDQELRQLERSLLEDGHGALVQWVRKYVAASKDEDLGDPPLWSLCSVQARGRRLVQVDVPAYENFRNYFDWSGLSVVPGAAAKEDLDRWSFGKVSSLRTITGQVIEFPLALVLSRPVFRPLSEETVGKPMLSFRPIRLHATQGVRFEFDNPTNSELSLMVVLFGRRGGTW